MPFFTGAANISEYHAVCYSLFLGKCPIFSTLMIDSGKKLETGFSREAIERFLFEAGE